MPVDHLKFSPDILRRLGEELIPHPGQGVVELAKNAYDANALRCRIELLRSEKVGGSIRITDDGDGMGLDDIRSGWLLVGRSSKTRRQRTRLGRWPVGEKGLGRLAALRMGTVVSLVTRPRHKPSIEYRLSIDWGKYENASTVEEIELRINTHRRPERRKAGTTITISHLHTALTRKDVKLLARDLLLLADPFEHRRGFRPILVAPEFKELERLVRKKYFDLAQFHLTGQIDSGGRAKVIVKDRNKRIKWRANHKDIRESEEPYKAPPSKFDCWIFLRKSSPSLGTTAATLSDLKDWLDERGGIHLYDRGLRVYPYGDPGHDWLDMNLLRARNPELRPSTKTTIGRVSTADPDQLLVQKTDRTGFVENEPFQELRSFAVEALEWLANRRIEQRDEGRRKEKKKAFRGVKRARTSLEQVIETVPPKFRSVLRDAIQRYERAREREVRILQSELQLYRTLATVGTSFAVFSHEVESPTTRIRKLAQGIETLAKKEIGGEAYDGTLRRAIDSIIRSAGEVRFFPRLALRLLQRDKRKTGFVHVHEVVSDVVDLFKPYLDRMSVTVKLDLADEDPIVVASRSAIESVITNLLTKSFHAFYADRRPQRVREILIRTNVSRDHTITLSVLDSGPGIKGIRMSDIWLPGRTTFPDGSGLGLTIVRDAVVDLGGEASAVANSELGGAEIIVEIPLHDGSK